MLPLQITLRDIYHSPVLENTIRKKVDKLKTFNGNIVSCHVVIEATQKHKHQGKLYNVRIDIIVPGKELVVTKKTNEDVYVAIRDSFNAIVRQLEEHTRKRHGRVKSHNHVMHGYVVRMIPAEGYGFIEGIDGNEYYFSITNMSNTDFNKLSIGDAVEYTPEMTNDGHQAQHVVKERHNHHADVVNY
jgi:ribosomal subunit interface protein